MSNFLTQQKRKQKNFVLIFIAILAITVIVVWWGFLKGNTGIPMGEIIGGTPSIAKKEVKINFGIFKNPILEELESFPQIKPIEMGTSSTSIGGRPNPFIPY